jgi:hypothetical protein
MGITVNYFHILLYFRGSEFGSMYVGTREEPPLNVDRLEFMPGS